MRLVDGVQTYVDGKRNGGAIYAKGIKSLSAFSRYAGDVELSSIRATAARGKPRVEG